MSVPGRILGFHVTFVTWIGVAFSMCPNGWVRASLMVPCKLASNWRRIGNVLTLLQIFPGTALTSQS
jgi:hypothetical protein